MATKPLLEIRKKLQGYADRGVLRGFQEKSSRNGKTIFAFQWLTLRPCVLIVDERKGELRFQDLLPGVDARSDLYSELKRFVASRADRKLPAHRRIDPKRAEAKLQMRRSNVSLVLAVHMNRYAYALTKILNLCNEIFGYLHTYQVDYLWDHFDIPQE